MFVTRTLASETVPTLTRICEFIGVSYDSAMLDYSSHSTYEPPSPKFVGTWRRKLSPYEVQLAEAKCGSMLTERGYELSGHPPLAARHRRWTISSSGRVAGTVPCSAEKRFGTSLFLADFASRRLHLDGWQLRVRKQLKCDRGEVSEVRTSLLPTEAVWRSTTAKDTTREVSCNLTNRTLFWTLPGAV